MAGRGRPKKVMPETVGLMAEDKNDLLIETDEKSEKQESFDTKSDDMVMIGCIWPSGILARCGKGNNKIKINGSNVSHDNANPKPLPKGAFGLTLLKRSDWEAILKYDAVIRQLHDRGMIYDSKNRNEAVAQAKDKKDFRHGLESVVPGEMTGPGGKKIITDSVVGDRIDE